jgi:hypothetical protein
MFFLLCFFKSSHPFILNRFHIHLLEERSRAQKHTPMISATQEAEARGLLELRSTGRILPLNKLKI